jgi:hypothetical protein
MAVIPYIKKTTMIDFFKQHIIPGSTVCIDGLKWFEDLKAADVRHVARTQPLVKQPQVYLDEFVFRHNRRQQPMAAFQTLLGLGTGHAPTPCRRMPDSHQKPLIGN